MQLVESSNPVNSQTRMNLRLRQIERRGGHGGPPLLMLKFEGKIGARFKVLVEGLFPTTIYQTRYKSGAKSVVNIDDSNIRRTGIEHSQ